MKYIYLVCVVLFLISCGPGDNTAPIVTISLPTEGQSFSRSDTMLVDATTEEDTRLASVVLTSDLGITQATSQFMDVMSHRVLLNILISEDTPLGNYTLSIISTDAEGNEGQDDVSIQITN